MRSFEKHNLKSRFGLDAILNTETLTAILLTSGYKKDFKEAYPVAYG
jgi:hypothetical protein